MRRWVSRKSSSFRSQRPKPVFGTRQSSTDRRVGERRVIAFGHPLHLQIDVGVLNLREAQPAIEPERGIIFLDEDADAFALAARRVDQLLENRGAKALAAP